MIYKAENIDTNKALQALNEARQYQEQNTAIEIAKLQARMDGIYKGIEIAESIFGCSNYEKDNQDTYIDGVLDLVYELGKEMDVLTQDIRDDFTSVDDACAELSKRIKDRYQQI